MLTYAVIRFLKILVISIIFLLPADSLVNVDTNSTNDEHRPDTAPLRSKIDDIAVFVLSSIDHVGLLKRDRYLTFWCVYIVLLFLYLITSCRIIGSSRTWMRLFSKVYVVLEGARKLHSYLGIFVNYYYSYYTTIVNIHFLNRFV